MRSTHPSIDRLLVLVLAEQVRRLSSHLTEALYLPAETRVLRRLEALARAYRTTDGAVRIPLTQDDIATMAGTTRPTVNRVRKAIEADGIIAMSRARIDLLDPDALARRAR